MKDQNTRLQEADIKHENGSFWVAVEPNAYVVYRAGITHSVSDSGYAKTENGLSIAIARCDYLARQATTKSDRMTSAEHNAFPNGRWS